MTIDKQTAAFGAKVLQNLPPELSSEEMQRLHDDPEELQIILRKAFCPFKVIKTIPLGGDSLKTIKDFYDAFSRDGIFISSWVESFFLSKGEIIVSTEKKKINIIATSVMRLGFNKKTYYQEVYKRASRYGLKKLSFEATFRTCFWIKYDQPKVRHYFIAMDPIHFNGDYRVFTIDPHNGMHLNEAEIQDNMFFPEDWLIFCQEN